MCLYREKNYTQNQAALRCTSQLGPDHVQVNCSWKWIADQKWIVEYNLGLVCQLLAEPAQILFCNSLLVYTIHFQLQFTCTSWWSSPWMTVLLWYFFIILPNMCCKYIVCLQAVLVIVWFSLPDCPVKSWHSLTTWMNVKPFLHIYNIYTSRGVRLLARS